MLLCPSFLSVHLFSGRHPPTLVVKRAVTPLLWVYSPQSKDPKENSKNLKKKKGIF